MKLILYVVLALAGTIAFTRIALDDPGYVLISRAPWTLEMSLVLFVGVVLVVFAVLYWLLRSVGLARRVPRAVQRWRRQRAAGRAQRTMVRGYLSLVEGDWGRAEQQLVAAPARAAGPPPIVNYLAAAYSAQQRGDLGARDRYLAEAHQGNQRAALAVGLTQARLLLGSDQTEDALDILGQLRDREPRNVAVLRLLLDVYRELGDWQGVLDTLPLARRAGAFSMSELDELERQALRRLIETAAAEQQGGDELHRVWQSLKSAQRREPALIESYAHRLLASGRMDECEALLRGALKREWSSRLAYLYGLVQGSDPAAQFKTAESWLEENRADPDLLLSLGRLAIQNRLWGKARSYLEASIGAGGRAETYRELGQLLEQLGETEQARDCYRQGMERVVAAPLARVPPPNAAAAQDAAAGA